MKWKEWFNYVFSYFLKYEKSIMTSVVHDRKNTHVRLNQDGGSVQIVTRKLDLHQTSMAQTHTERHIRDQTQFSFANLSLDDSDDI